MMRSGLLLLPVLFAFNSVHSQENHNWKAEKLNGKVKSLTEVQQKSPKDPTPLYTETKEFTPAGNLLLETGVDAYSNDRKVYIYDEKDQLLEWSFYSTGYNFSPEEEIKEEKLILRDSFVWNNGKITRAWHTESNEWESVYSFSHDKYGRFMMQSEKKPGNTQYEYSQLPDGTLLQKSFTFGDTTNSYSLVYSDTLKNVFESSIYENDTLRQKLYRTFDSDGNEISSVNLAADPNNTEYAYLEGNGKTKITEYNKFGHYTRVVIVDSGQIRELQRVEYTYDEKNNWILQKEYSNQQLRYIVRRTLSYYE